MGKYVSRDALQIIIVNRGCRYGVNMIFGVWAVHTVEGNTSGYRVFVDPRSDSLVDVAVVGICTLRFGP